jgi:hypothetical protein
VEKERLVHVRREKAPLQTSRFSKCYSRKRWRGGKSEEKRSGEKMTPK